MRSKRPWVTLLIAGLLAMAAVSQTVDGSRQTHDESETSQGPFG